MPSIAAKKRHSYRYRRFQQLEIRSELAEVTPRSSGSDGSPVYYLIEVLGHPVAATPVPAPLGHALADSRDQLFAAVILAAIAKRDE